MRICKKCNIKVKTSNNFCPLCQNKLIGKKEENDFPNIIPIYKRYLTFLKIILFITVTISLISIAIDLIINKYHFSIFVLIGSFCLLIFIKTTLTKRDSIYKTILWQLVVLGLISLLWDYLTGFNTWSITYVIPILCITSNIVISTLTIIFHDCLEDNLIYFICMIFIGLIPLIFVLMDISNKIPSIICIFFNLICFLTLLIFKYKDVKEELKRRMHI